MSRILTHPLRCGWIWVLAFLFLSPLSGQSPVLELEKVEVFPGKTDLPLSVTLTNDALVTALDLGIQYESLVLRVSEFRLD